jgi:hypothetical protein
MKEGRKDRQGERDRVRQGEREGGRETQQKKK